MRPAEQPLRGGRRCDAVAEHLVFIDDHIPHVDCRHGISSPGRREAGCCARHQGLRRDGALDGPDDARKLQQETVAGVLYNPAAVIEEDRMERSSMGLERGVVPASSIPIIRE